jgi:ubiquinone/menaquinone biosynthesis C-methylase UbiE
MGSKEYFDQVAPEWDNMRKQFFSDSLRDKAIEKASVTNGKTAADIGAGTGFITEALLKNELDVIAVDQSEEMLKFLSDKFSGSGNIVLKQGNSSDLPVESGSVDYVFANMYLHHVEDPRTAIKEMVRILKEDGKLIITDLDEHNHEFLLKEHKDRWMGFKREHITDWFINAGLKDVSVDCAGEKCSSASTCCSDSANISIFLASGIKNNR